VTCIAAGALNCAGYRCALPALLRFGLHATVSGRRTGPFATIAPHARPGITALSPARRADPRPHPHRDAARRRARALRAPPLAPAGRERFDRAAGLPAPRGLRAHRGATAVGLLR